LCSRAECFFFSASSALPTFSRTLRHFWPVFVVIVGVSKLVHLRSVWSGLWMIAIGAWLQAVTLHFHGLTFESSWPLLLMVLGAGIILRTIVGSFQRRDNEERESHHV